MSSVFSNNNMYIYIYVLISDVLGSGPALRMRQNWYVCFCFFVLRCSRIKIVINRNVYAITNCVYLHHFLFICIIYFCIWTSGWYTGSSSPMIFPCRMWQQKQKMRRTGRAAHGFVPNKNISADQRFSQVCIYIYIYKQTPGPDQWHALCSRWANLVVVFCS